MTHNSLTQYIDLYSSNIGLINGNSAPAMNRLREKALGLLEQKRLPEKGDEGYETTSVNGMFAPDYGVNLARIAVPSSQQQLFKCGVPNLSTRQAIIGNDTLTVDPKLSAKLPEGMVLCTLREAAVNYSDLLEKHYGKIADIENASTALNTLLAQDGVFIYMPKGVRMEKPLQLISVFNALQPLLAVRRTVIVLEPESSLQILTCDHSGTTPETECMSSFVAEVYVGENAELGLFDIEENSANAKRNAQYYIEQQAHSKITLNAISLSGGVTRNDFVININGKNAETLLAGMVVGKGNQHVDNCTVVRHNAPNCHSRQLFKYVLDDDSTGAFGGTIVVTPEAPFTEAYQNNRNILSSPNARMHTRPHLEIYNDDVKCSHGAATGQLDREAMFYMQTRGIPEAEARTMLTQAFMDDVVATIPVEELRERISHLIERRLRHCDSHCAECKV